MYQIISHRGWWKDPSEKNLEIAFRRSFESGFGTETDIRDLNCELVISHDMPLNGVMTFEKFLDIYTNIDPDLPLALNIKSDGLFDALKNQLKKRDLQNWFAFDMSVPDMFQFSKRDIKFYTRQSEFETIPSLLKEANGVWIDELITPWLSRSVLKQHLELGKQICLVSPELHARPYDDVWGQWKIWQDEFHEEGIDTSSITICTDYPDQAIKIFTECDKK